MVEELLWNDGLLVCLLVTLIVFVGLEIRIIIRKEFAGLYIDDFSDFLLVNIAIMFISFVIGWFSAMITVAGGWFITLIIVLIIIGLLLLKLLLYKLFFDE